jgi:hypothetical protein
MTTGVIKNVPWPIGPKMSQRNSIAPTYTIADWRLAKARNSTDTNFGIVVVCVLAISARRIGEKRFRIASGAREMAPKTDRM